MTNDNYHLVVLSLGLSSFRFEKDCSHIINLGGAFAELHAFGRCGVLRVK